MRPALASILLLAVPALAHAEPPPADEPVVEGAPAVTRELSLQAGDVRTNLSDWAVGPPGWDVGGELVFLTSDLGLAEGRALQMTDVGVARARVRYTASQRVELSGAVDLLAKQPAYTDERPFQGARAGLKVAVNPTWALATGVSGGPTLDVMGDDGGLWASAATAVVYRKHPDQTLSFQLTGGALATALRLPADDPWLTEATLGGQLMLHTPNGWFGMWAGASLAIPVVHHDALDPATRLDVDLGAAYAVVEDWDIYVEGSIRDRGDAGMPATQLPILDGGFDQRQLMVGVARRFAGKDRHTRDALLIGAN